MDYGLINQGNIMWNGEDDSPNQDAHAKTKDKAKYYDSSFQTQFMLNTTWYRSRQEG